MLEKISCKICQRLISPRGMHTHMERAHGTPEQKAKYSSGNHGKYDQITERIRQERERYIPTTFCKNCNKPLIFNKRRQKFCDRSCSVSYSNKNRDRSIYEKISETNKRDYESGKTLPWNIGLSYTQKNTASKHIYCKVSFCSICGITIPNKQVKTCSSGCKSALLSRLNRENPNCGGKRNSKNFKTIDSLGNEATLESTYELRLSEILNQLGVTWTRPKFLFYEQNGIKRRYYPDFFLPDYNLFLDPKNDYLIPDCWDKISLVQDQNEVVIAIMDNHSLNIEFVEDLLNSIER